MVALCFSDFRVTLIRKFWHFFLIPLQDELARLRRQSISRIPTGRASAVFRQVVIDEGSPSKSKEGLNNSIEGSFLHFGRALQSPTVLDKKVANLVNQKNNNRNDLDFIKRFLLRSSVQTDGYLVLITWPSSDSDELFVLNSQIKSLEAVLAGALRREQAAECQLKKSSTEMEHLVRLVGQWAAFFNWLPSTQILIWR